MRSIVLLSVFGVIYVSLSMLLRARQRALGIAPTAEVRKAIWVGIAWINAPVWPILLGPLAIKNLVLPGGSDAISGLLLLLGFVLARAWWSVNVSLWRRRAARHNIGPVALQFEGESSSLLWPRGHFFPFYLGEHANRTCRRLHFAGTSIALAMLIAAVITQQWWFIVAALIQGYALAWVGHFFFEHNQPATFKYPLFSFMGDWRLWWEILIGKVRL